jgi:hypothetical protein
MDAMSVAESVSSEGKPGTEMQAHGRTPTIPVGTPVPIGGLQDIRRPQRFLSSHGQVQHHIPHQQQKFTQQVHMPGMPPQTVMMQPVGYPPHAMPMHAPQWQGGQSGHLQCVMVMVPATDSMPSVLERPDVGQTETEEETPTPQVDMGWNSHYTPAGIVHGTPQALMHQHHVLQPIPAQYGYPMVQAGLRYYVTPQQVQWHPAQAQQVQAPPVTHPEKEVPLPPLNPDYAAYAFKKSFDFAEGGIIYSAPSNVKSKTEQLDSEYAMYSFKGPIEEAGTVYEAPYSDYQQKNK